MATLERGRSLRAPAVFPETKPYWDAAAEGRLLIKWCTECDRLHHYPRSLCPFCGSDQTSWKQATGRGRIYALSVTRRGPGAPFAIAYVTLDEGVTLLANIVDCDLDELRIGDAVQLVFRSCEGGQQQVPMFRPAGGIGSMPS